MVAIVSLGVCESQERLRLFPLLTMNALRFKQFGPPSVLFKEELPIPQPSFGEALVEVKASGINPSDIASISGRFKSTLPMTPGRDFAGVVIQGEGWVGKQVWGSCPGFGVDRPGAHADFVTLPIAWLSEKPKNLSMEQSAAVGIPFLTAWESLVNVGQLRENERVLITGSNGAVGHAAAQVARSKKAFVIGADLSEASIKVDVFVLLNGVALDSEVRRLTQGAGVDLVLDLVGGELFESCLRSLKIGGRQIAIASPSQPIVKFNLMDFYHNRSRLFGVDSVKLTGPEIATIMDQLREGFERGALEAPAIQVHQFASGIEVYQNVAEKKARGKQVLDWS
jgi:NADPH:quinone reductase